MLAYVHVPFGWKELGTRTAKEISADHLLNLAAQRAYCFFFAPFPDEVNCHVDRGSPQVRQNGRRASDLIIGAAGLAPVAMAKGIREKVNARTEGAHETDAA